MISISQLWTFHLYVATFQQYLYMKYLSLIWSDSPKLKIANMTWLTVTEYMCHKWPHIYVSLVVIMIRSFPHSWLITGFVTSATRRVLHAEHELPTLPKHLCSPVVSSGVRVTRSCVVCVMFYWSLFLLCPFLAIVLSVLLRFKDYDYSFGIFKLFLLQICAIFCVLHELIITHSCNNLYSTVNKR